MTSRYELSDFDEFDVEVCKLSSRIGMWCIHTSIWRVCVSGKFGIMFASFMHSYPALLDSYSGCRFVLLSTGDCFSKCVLLGRHNCLFLYKHFLLIQMLQRANITNSNATKAASDANKVPKRWSKKCKSKKIFIFWSSSCYSYGGQL